MWDPKEAHVWGSLYEGCNSTCHSATWGKLARLYIQPDEDVTRKRKVLSDIMMKMKKKREDAATSSAAGTPVPKEEKKKKEERKPQPDA